MKTVGIFEAKTKFTSLCEEVVRTGQAVVVSKRGAPMVLVSPVPSNFGSNRPDILRAWREWTDVRGPEESEFPVVWKLRGRTKNNPLTE
ncbi:MAG: type II toxin-antitoxin system Phd/YefM family antitoxin [Terrimicrobiaceae bacterium]